ncbi:MAG: biotin synthase BioB [Candidatus Omnitrophica bacterium]|nr:biotin synthase BioB [Candidatus Omnitrophota bacterium]
MERGRIEQLIELPLDELIFMANKARREGIGAFIETCGIINAKSGACGEDCRFCAQSSHYSSSIKKYPLKDIDTIVSSARKAKSNGSKKFGIVTSGNSLSDEELEIVCGAVSVISKDVGISPCASLGALSYGAFRKLKESGLQRYHHNIETSGNFYPNIVSTHVYGERVATIISAKKAGLEVCSGGILGMGESWSDRIDMAFLLKELDVESVPLNFLVPIKGTPMENTPPISPHDAIRTIAIFRILLPDKTIKVVAGRESVLKDHQEDIFAAGANGMLVGGYLTIQGRSVAEDVALLKDIERTWNNG